VASVQGCPPVTGRPRRSIHLLAVIAVLLFATADPWARSSSIQTEPNAPLTLRVNRATSDVTIDGAIDEPAWSDALSVELNYEVRPGENIEPPVRTECLVTYDSRFVYFGFRAYDPDPSDIRARFSDRDKAWNDDWVGVVLDTFNDQRRAYELISNPLGVQIDAINDEVGQTYDDSWNAFWHSRGRITPQGYEVEMAIPFSQVRFQSSENGEAQTWGFDAMRSYPRSDRHHIGLFARERGNNSYLSQTVKLVGMEEVSPGKNLEIMPTLTASRTDSRDSLPDSPLERGDFQSDLGLTVRWGITPNVSLNAAVNPDFSQVEADALRLNINEQFALFFPETRPFFLENADYFNTPLGLVYTRNVADPETAMKMTGKNGRHTYGLFAAQDEITNVIFPEAEGSAADSFNQESTSTVGRYRYDFGSNSTIGGTITDRNGDDYFNRVASGDTTIRFTEADRVTLSFAASKTQYNDEMVQSQGVRSDPFSDDAMTLEYAHTVRDWWVELRRSDFGEGFRSDLGWRPRVDLVDSWVGGARIWWGEDGNFYRRMAWGGGVGSRERQNGDLLEDYVETWFNLNGPMESFMSFNATFRDQGFDGERFEDQLSLHGWYEIQANPNLNLSFHSDYGDWIDYENIQPATRTLVQPGVRFNLGRHLALQYNHTYTTLEVEDGHLYRVHAPEVRIVHQFNTRSFLRAILQYTDIRRDSDLYAGGADPKTTDLFAQLLFAYKVNPQTALYVGYTDSYVGSDDYSLTQSARTLFVKLGYAWVR
jgi:hypothetical protein